MRRCNNGRRKLRYCWEYLSNNEKNDQRNQTGSSSLSGPPVERSWKRGRSGLDVTEAAYADFKLQNGGWCNGGGTGCVSGVLFFIRIAVKIF